MTLLENLKYTLADFWRYRVKNVPRIRLAVVGRPASGKSYIINDIMQAYASMGFNQHPLKKNGIGYGTPAQYLNDVIEGGTMLRGEDYACRAENHYGAVASYGSKKEFDIDYLNIPGETFRDKRNIGLFYKLYEHLNTNAKNFRLVTWARSTGEEVYVVEPLHGDTSELEAALASSERRLQGIREGAYLSWGQIFAELHEGGYKMTPKHKLISGRTLLRNLMAYNIDSVINSIGTIAITFGIKHLETKQEYNNFKKKFYFLNYCKNATDIVICDKLLVPDEGASTAAATQSGDAMFFSDLCNNLIQFFPKSGSRPNVYLAFRGVDFLMHNREDSYKAIQTAINADDDIENKDEEMRNAQYSVFAYALWRHIDPRVTVRPEEQKDVLGTQLTDAANGDIEATFLNLASGTVADGGTVSNYISSHIGRNTAGTFSYLLNFAYPSLALASILDPIDYIVPHVYFTGTPITLDFLIYRNDPANKNARFICKDIEGSARYFDQCGSNHCFGSYQLALDILQQHGICLNQPGDLLLRCQATK